MICKWCGETLKNGTEKCPSCGRKTEPLSECGGFYNIVPGALAVQRSGGQHAAPPAQPHNEQTASGAPGVPGAAVAPVARGAHDAPAKKQTAVSAVTIPKALFIALIVAAGVLFISTITLMATNLHYDAGNGPGKNKEGIVEEETEKEKNDVKKPKDEKKDTEQRGGGKDSGKVTAETTGPAEDEPETKPKPDDPEPKETGSDVKDTEEVTAETTGPAEDEPETKPEPGDTEPKETDRQSDRTTSAEEETTKEGLFDHLFP